jgi:cation diffusion facilitator CzcD-associated flavoprotein CzcO
MLFAMGNEHVVIVGTGFAGLGTGIRLKQAGFHDFTILEQAGEVGGTWRDNHYPGAACDIESHLYSFSFEPNPNWSRQFGSQWEILQYLKGCAQKYGLYPHIRFHSTVKSATFDERAGQWTVETEDGKTIRARAVVLGTGGLSRPKLPIIPGLESFAGKSFHSARWDHSTPLDGKTVGVIGTGASAIQIVPEIAPRVKKLHVFQRTPPWIVPKNDFPIGDAARARYRKMPLLQKLARTSLYWRHELFALGFVVEPKVMSFMGRQVERWVARQVKDPALRKKVTPDYTLGCKRVLISNDWYAALQRDNVELVTEGIDEVRPQGIATHDGKLRHLDAIVLATGFQASEAVAPFAVRGRGGRDLARDWESNAEAYLGTTISGFPNLFTIVGPNTGLGHSSMVFIIESQIAYILDALRTMREKNLKMIDVRADVQREYNDEMQRRLAKTVWASGCQSWYLTKSGRNTTLWPGFTVEYRLRTRRFDADRYELVSNDARATSAPATYPAASVSERFIRTPVSP